MLAYDEFREVYRVLAVIRITRCPPTTFDLRSFLVGRLQMTHPHLAAKIEVLSDDEIRQLCERVAEQQRIDRWILS